MSFLKKIFGKEEIEVTTATENENILYAALDGVIKPITASSDPVFSQKMMGDGYLIEPTGSTVVSPVNGTIQVVFPTKHAIGILSDNGDDIIIHVGLDTVKLDGKGFTSFVEQGQRVTVGDKLLEVDFEFLKENVPSIATPVVVTNIGNRELKIIEEQTVTVGDKVAEIK